MKTTIATFAGIAAATLALSSCKVEQTEEGELPSVDVDVEGDAGNMPEFDVDAPEVDVDMKKVEIPDTIKVPDVDVIMPDEDGDE